jgi:hypothetical protein
VNPTGLSNAELSTNYKHDFEKQKTVNKNSIQTISKLPKTSSQPQTIQT